MYLSSTIIISVQALTAANCKNIFNEKGCGFFAEVKMDDIVPKMAYVALYMKKGLFIFHFRGVLSASFKEDGH